MASTKISALPAASTLTGAETIPLVQGGVTKKVTTDQFLTATNPSYTGTLTGGTGVVNLGSGQFVKDASGNVGVGTVSPGAKLDVAGTASATALQLSGNQIAAPYSGKLRIGDILNNYSGLEIAAGGAVAVNVDALGNLGIGTTPNAWGIGFKSIQLGAGTALTNANSITQSWLSSNAFYDTGWKYMHSAESSYYQQSLGSHSWYTAPSGTAGNPISFTQAMTLASDGRLTFGAGTNGAIGGGSGLSMSYETGGTYQGGNIQSFAGNTLNLNPLGNVIKFGNGWGQFDASGNLIQTVNTTAATLSTNGTLTFSIVDNSTLRVSVRGSDGTTRTATLALT